MIQQDISAPGEANENSPAGSPANPSRAEYDGSNGRASPGTGEDIVDAEVIAA